MSDNQSNADSLDEPPVYFRIFTRDSLKQIRQRMVEAESKKKEEDSKGKRKKKLDDEESESGPQPSEKLEQGQSLPIRLSAAFDPDSHANIPLEDFDPFYRTIPTFVIVTKKQDIFRFSATDGMWLLSPFNPVRRIAVTILTHGLFSLAIITTILANCYVMIMPSSPFTESTEVVFTAIYTFESALKVMARGFILEKFTYLRDAWNWLDFVVVSLAYVTMGIDLGNLSALKTVRVFRALKTVAIVPGLKTIVGAVIESVKNLRDVIILTMFALSIFGLVGLQIYMGVLTQKCVKDFPEDGSEGEERDENWHAWNLNYTNWFPYPPPADYGDADYPLCGNSSGSGTCPINFTCLQGYGPNPNYGYTSFDSFGWAFLASFRLMTQDFWESLYQQILRSAGPWHMLFFIVIIFLGSYYLVNLILAIVAMSYDELQKKAEEDALADAEEAELMREEEAARAAKLEARAQAAAAAAKGSQNDPQKSPSQYSSSLPGSPYNARRHNWQPYGVDLQNDIPYVDDSAAPTPMTEANGTNIQARLSRFKRMSSFSPGSRLSSPNSHDMYGGGRQAGAEFGQPLTKERQFIQRAEIPYYRDTPIGSEKFHDGKYTESLDSIFKVKTPTERKKSESHTPAESTKVDMEDITTLKDIIEQASRKASVQSSSEPIPFKELVKQKVTKALLRLIDIFCLWDCGVPWSIFRKGVSFIVFDAFTELTITLATIACVAFMAMDHYGLEENYSMNMTLQTGNMVFTVLFTLECAMKVIAMTPKYFFQVGWNIFDFLIVAFSLVEVIFEDANLPGLSALRSFRLLRVFKLAKSWPALNMIMTIMGKTVGALSNLVFVLVIIIFIFAVMGMQLFAENYLAKTHLFPGGALPRWNFTDFGHSFMIIFRVLCGEWIESMWDCMLVNGAACVPFFLATVVIGNLVILNLFLALLLSSFGASNLAPPSENEVNKLAEAFDRIGRFNGWVKAKIKNWILALVDLCVRAKTRIVPRSVQNARNEDSGNLKHNVRDEEQEIGLRRRTPRLSEAAKLMTASIGDINYPYPTWEKMFDIEDGDYDGDDECKKEEDHRMRTDSLEDEEEDDDDENDHEDLEEEGEQEQEKQVEEDNLTYPEDCMPRNFYERFPAFAVDDTPFGAAWANLRLKSFRLIEDQYFETVVIIMILLSSLALALEDVHLPKNPALRDFLFYMDRVFTILFFFEMLLKWVALGFVKYFTNAWCWLDFVIVMVSVINFIAAMAGAGKVQAFKTMRTLRALRPLRAMSRMQGMRIVVNALIGAIPSIANVLMVCLIFWLIFAIMGVQLFSGKFHKCLDPEDGSRPDYRVIRNKLECLANNFTWENSVMNFDHVGKAYLSLFQVATFKGWIGIMNDAIDSREIDDQPHREVSFGMYGYFVTFIIFGSFFTLNLFIGVIIDNFNEQKKKSGGSMEMFMTEDQKKYYAAMQKMGNKKPIKAIPQPRWKPQAIVFKLVINQKFDMITMGLIGLNMITMTMDHYQMSKEWDDFLNVVNCIFVAIFTCECFLKIFCLRHHYFKEPWNLFDLVVVFMSVAGMILSDLIEKYFVSPTLLRVVRVAKVGRVLRLVKGAKGIRTLLFALAMSLPALFNICLLLFLVMFIFSIFGMSFFMNVKLRGSLDDVYNFQTFGQSIILLFQMSTSAGWDGVLDGIMNEDDCDLPDPENGRSGDCGNTTVGIAFMLSYLVMSFLIIINMYIAVILENYSQATEDVQEGLTDDDYDMYYEIWAQFDPDGTQYIRYDQLSDFLDALEPPLQIRKPNKYKIIFMDLPICQGDMINCVDILDALTKDFFARKGNQIEEPPAEVSEVQVAVDRPNYEPISSTLWREREEYCARVIQNMWRTRKSLL